MWTEIGWLAGIIDGEGSFMLNMRLRNSARPVVNPVFSLPNTNLPIIERARTICEQTIGVSPRVYGYEWKGHRPMYHLRIMRKHELRPFCERMKWHLVSKREQAQIVLDYLDLAPGKGAKAGPRDVYDGRIAELIARIRHLNRRYAPNEWGAAGGNTSGPEREATEEVAAID